jgi:hypothetical protein
MKHKLRRIVLVLATTLAVASCTPQEAKMALAQLGYSIDDHSAAKISEHYSTPKSPAALIRQRWAGTGQAERAVRVASCESGGGKESGINHLAQNPDSTAFGPFQFLNKTWASTGIAKTKDLGLQIEAAYRLWQARGWQPWNASRHCWG